MFTGLVQEVGRVLGKQITATRGKLRLKTHLAEILQLGESIAVNGVCLTVTAKAKDWVEADVMPPTLNHTNLKFLKLLDPVNLEPALRIGDRLGGHFVSGHVDGTGKVDEIKAEKNAVLIKVSMEKELRAGMNLKGSIALDGVSLTIQEITDTGIMVGIIPHTFQQTRFKWLQPGDIVNIETDLMAKYVNGERAAPADREGISLDFLRLHGYAK